MSVPILGPAVVSFTRLPVGTGFIFAQNKIVQKEAIKVSSSFFFFIVLGKKPLAIIMLITSNH
jgi:hypothetical protein